MAYVEYDSANPDGSQTGPNAILSMRSNDRSLRDAAIIGAFKSYDYSQSGGTARQPATIFFKNGAIWLKGSITWGTTSGAKYNPTQIIWELSTNTGGAFDQIATQTFTYDSSGNMTAMTNASALTSYLLSCLGRVRIAEEALANHVADVVVDAPHGIAGMAGQAPATVAITGGNIKTATQRLVRTVIAGTQSAPFNIDLSLGHFFVVTVAAGAVISFTNIPSAGDVHPITIRLTNGGTVAFGTLFPGSKTRPGGTNPALTSSGTDDLFGYFQDGATFEITGSTLAKA